MIKDTVANRMRVLIPETSLGAYDGVISSFDSASLICMGTVERDNIMTVFVRSQPTRHVTPVSRVNLNTRDFKFVCTC